MSRSRPFIRIGDGPGGNYVFKVRQFVAQHPELEGKYTDLDIRHDNWCAIYRSGPCNCDPDVELLKPQVLVGPK
jgi:hypothetical protein